MHHMQSAPSRRPPRTPATNAWEAIRTAIMVPLFTGLIWWIANQSVGETRRFTVRLRVAGGVGWIATLESSPEFTLVLAGPNRLLDRLEAGLAGVGDFLDYRLTPSEAESGPVFERDAREVLYRTSLIERSGLTIETIEPPEVRFRVDRLVAGEVSVQPDFGTIEVVSSAVTPPRVGVEMPGVALGNLNGKVTVQVENALRDWTASHPGEIDFSLTAAVEIDGALRVEPTQVTLSGRVVGLLGTKQVGPIQILPGVPLAMQKRFLIEPAGNEDFRADLTVRGPKDRLSQLEPDRIQAYFDVKTADEALAGQTINRRAVVVLPPGIELVGEPPEVSFKLTPKEGAAGTGTP